jgi:putative acetyltransferase
MEIRAEQPEDIEAIRQVNTAAFGRSGEADLVDRLRGVASTLSLVAVQSSSPGGVKESGQVVGHIFFSPVTIRAERNSTGSEREREDVPVLGLAPVAVLPDHQRQGIGSRLIQQGLKECAQAGCKAIVVLGSPDYYPRFGFIPAREKRLKCEYDVPEEAFMVLELEKGALDNCAGTVKYRSEFSKLE